MPSYAIWVNGAVDVPSVVKYALQSGRPSEIGIDDPIGVDEGIFAASKFKF
jgi:hypothetical protein